MINMGCTTPVTSCEAMPYMSGRDDGWSYLHGHLLPGNPPTASHQSSAALCAGEPKMSLLPVSYI